jgi:hypothetical protein
VTAAVGGRRCQAMTVCVPLVEINGPSYRLKNHLAVTKGGGPLE